MTPSEAARNDQYLAPSYPGIDNWSDSNLHKGNIVYIWEVNNQNRTNEGNAYAMTPNTAFACEGDPNKLQDLLQTDLSPKYLEHRGHLQAYQINGEVPAAFSHTQANSCHGSGGGEQYFIPDFNQHLAEGNISKINDLNLDFNKATLPIDQDRIDLDQINTAYQQMISSSSPEPSPGTTPTLEGAYTSPTLHKANDLKNNINDIQKEWDKVGKSSSENIASTNGGSSLAPPSQSQEGRSHRGPKTLEEIEASKNGENAQKGILLPNNNSSTDTPQNAKNTGTAVSGGISP